MQTSIDTTAPYRKDFRSQMYYKIDAGILQYDRIDISAFWGFASLRDSCFSILAGLCERVGNSIQKKGKSNMNIKKITANNTEIAVVNNDEVCISDVQSALDFMISVNHETGNHSIIINKEAIVEDFFILSTRLAGEILQKFITYQFKLAIVGDFSGYTSKPLKDFIYESNHGKDIFFVSSEKEAIEKLDKA